MRRSAASSLIGSSLIGLSVGLLAGCPDRSISEVNPIQGRVEAKDVPVNVNRNLDLLFVIDDSPSMADKQINLAENFPRFIEVLSSIPGGLPSIHIGVVTSDMGTQGAGDNNPDYGPNIGQIGMGGCAGIGKNGDLQTFGAPIGNMNNFIADVITNEVTGARQPNYTGQLKDVFAQMAKAGAGGCGFEQHLEAMRAALQPSKVINQRFVRNADPSINQVEAYLGVIFIADEDDCSLQHYSMLGPESAALGPQQSFRCSRFGVTCDQNGQTPNQMNQVGPKGQCHPNDNSEYLAKVSEYVTFLKGLKSSPRKVIVAGILGAPEPFRVVLRPPPRSNTAIPALDHSCQYIGGDITGDGIPDPEVADPPTRLKFFLDQFPNRNTMVSICQKDLSGGLQQIGDLLKTVIGDPCIEGKLKNFAAPGAPPVYDCSVSYVTNPGELNTDETLMPKCEPESAAATNKPCWRIAVDAMNCMATESHNVLKIEGQDELKALGGDVHVLANCVTEVN